MEGSTSSRGGSNIQLGRSASTTPIYMRHKQAEIERARRGFSIVACSHSVKLCAFASQRFQSQQSDALTRM